MFVTLIRHGETDGNANRIVQPPETPLNERGIQQAELLADRLAREGVAVSRLISSDLARARMTAEPIARRLDLELEFEPLLQERNFGDFRGRSYDDIEVDIMAEGIEPPSGESWETFHARVEQLWQTRSTEYLNSAEDGAVLLITHGLVLYSMAARIFGLAEESLPERWGNTCLSRFTASTPHRAELLACTRHLDDHARDDDGAIVGI